MKIEDFKCKLMTFANEIVDGYFPEQNGALGKVANTTCKYVLKNKADEFDAVLCLFAKNGEIDAIDFVTYMKENMIGPEGLRIRIKDYIGKPGSVLGGFIPDKTIVISKEDLDKLI